MFKKNCCDGVYNSIDIHFTSACDNKCKHCIDEKYEGVNNVRPNVNRIMETLLKNCEGVDDILFLGGEPCLYLEEMLECVKIIQANTSLKIYVTTAIPKTCHDKRDLFLDILRRIDGLNLSVQHHDEHVADEIRQTTSRYNRQEFYNSLPHKEKIRINLNIVKPFLFTKEDISNCLHHYDKMGFNSIKLSEIQHGKDHFVSFEETFDIKMGSPFYTGCQQYLDPQKLFPHIKTPILLKRSCFMCEETLKAFFMDGVKAVYKALTPAPKNKYGIIYSNGLLTKGWI